MTVDYVVWRKRVLQLGNVVGQEARKQREAYRNALFTEVHNNPVDKVLRFLSLSQQGFFLSVLGVQPRINGEFELEER